MVREQGRYAFENSMEGELDWEYSTYCWYNFSLSWSCPIFSWGYVMLFLLDSGWNGWRSYDQIRKRFLVAWCCGLYVFFKGRGWLMTSCRWDYYYKKSEFIKLIKEIILKEKDIWWGICLENAIFGSLLTFSVLLHFLPKRFPQHRVCRWLL
jgi:hypothetical protein